MQRTWKAATTLALLVFAAPSLAAEPNETEFAATWLPPGTLTVSDELTQPPDTMMAALDHFGNVNESYLSDDDGPHANTFASALTGVPTNSGEIRFAVTGLGDYSFSGDHFEQGRYLATIDAYDVLGDLIETYDTAVFTLQPGSVHQYARSAFNSYVMTYDVYINNVVNFAGSADKDFFRFTGLTPGATFTAETFDPTSSGVDTLIGWYSEEGYPLATDDDSGAGPLSKLVGVVPTNGEVKIGVTGTGDGSFLGEHQERGAYDLKLTLGGGGYAADFNDDGYVNAADLLKWKQAFGQTAAGDANNDLRTDGTDFLIWQRQNGSGPGASESATATAAAVPEPATLAISTFGLAAFFGFVRKGRR